MCLNENVLVENGLLNTSLNWPKTPNFKTIEHGMKYYYGQTFAKKNTNQLPKEASHPFFFSFPLPAAFHPKNNRHWKSNGIFDTLRFTIFAYKLITIAILVERATHPYGEISFAFGPHRWEFYCCKFYGWTNYKLNRSSLSAAFFVCHSHISTVALNIESVHIKCNEIWEFAFFF